MSVSWRGRSDESDGPSRSRLEDFMMMVGKNKISIDINRVTARKNESTRIMLYSEGHRRSGGWC